ncbi:MarR family winged helix-turn-helix transcriptional regulator [Aliiroseovarius sp.]|uniref:MarR family winged helix-turn-helix transcriptional regulator n=1 Tax=Aliiroseovarius sp. TaxID=1872442 RepID=UPI003BAB290B
MTKVDDLYAVTWMSRPLMQAAEVLVERELQGSGLTVRMRAVLEILAREDGLPVPELARQLHIQRQYVQVMVNEALAAGLVEKRDNPRHKRSVLIALTPAGETQIRAVMTREQTIMARLAEGFEADELAVVRRVMGRVLTKLLEEGKS